MEEWTEEDEQNFRRLNRRRMKHYRDKKRVRKYTPRPDKRRETLGVEL